MNRLSPDRFLNLRDSPICPNELPHKRFVCGFIRPNALTAVLNDVLIVAAEGVWNDVKICDRRFLLLHLMGSLRQLNEISLVQVYRTKQCQKNDENGQMTTVNLHVKCLHAFKCLSPRILVPRLPNGKESVGSLEKDLRSCGSCQHEVFPSPERNKGVWGKYSMLKRIYLVYLILFSEKVNSRMYPEYTAEIYKIKRQ